MSDNNISDLFNSSFITISIGRSILSSLLATANGIVIYILTEIYKYISHISVEWENHIYKSDE